MYHDNITYVLIKSLFNVVNYSAHVHIKRLADVQITVLDTCMCNGNVVMGN